MIIKSMIDEKYNGSSKWKGFISAKFDKANFEIPCISEVYLRIYKLCKCKEIKSIIGPKLSNLIFIIEKHIP